MNANAARPLGKNQRRILEALVYRRPTRSPHESPDRPYPDGGWCWDNHSNTVRLLDSLVKRGLAEERAGGRYFITEAGREELKPAWLKKREAEEKDELKYDYETVVRIIAERDALRKQVEKLEGVLEAARHYSAATRKCESMGEVNLAIELKNAIAKYEDC